MGFNNCFLFRSRSICLLASAERCGLPRDDLVPSCSLVSFKRCGMRSGISAREGFGDGILECSGFSGGFLALRSGFLERRIRKGCLIPHRSHGFTISAMSESRDSENGAQMAFTEAATSSKYPCMYVKNTVYSGETIEYSGNVVVLGDVQEGGAIMADGDVVVLGRLHGDVHGGRNGDRDAVVYATQLDACHIRIAEATALVSKSQFPGCPVIASVHEDGTLGIRAAVQESIDNKEAKTSRVSESKDQASSNRPAQLALFTGVYISLVGVALLVFPTSLFGVLFDVRSVTVGWIRVGAILAVVFGVYYIGTAVGDMRGSSGARAFYMSTVVGRVFLFFGFCWLVAAGAAQRALLLLGIVNMLGAMSMLIALRQDSNGRVLKT
ncbi:hypothetical protein M758_2G131800 [Ceratodon purpureus]|nr:hypothetical protein M758_2G131800 [Ceratodon purpureus]